MRWYLDTEFWERPNQIDLISIGLVSEDGQELYYVNDEFDWNVCSNDWLQENVRPELLHTHYSPYVTTRELIVEDVLSNIPPSAAPQFWGYYADYDWVVFCWLFGAMVDLPKGYPMYCRDLKQWADMVGALKFEGPNRGEHNALVDARWNRELYDYLEQHVLEGAKVRTL